MHDSFFSRSPEELEVRIRVGIRVPFGVRVGVRVKAGFRLGVRVRALVRVRVRVKMRGYG